MVRQKQLFVIFTSLILLMFGLLISSAAAQNTDSNIKKKKNGPAKTATGKTKQVKPTREVTVFTTAERRSRKLKGDGDEEREKREPRKGDPDGIKSSHKATELDSKETVNEE